MDGAVLSERLCGFLQRELRVETVAFPTKSGSSPRILSEEISEIPDTEQPNTP